VRVPAVGAEPDYIAGLARLVQGASGRATAVCSSQGERVCPRQFSGCPMDNPET